MDEWFWAMTLQWQEADGSFTASTLTGRVILPPSALRSETFDSAMTEARRMSGIPADAPVAVLFFTLEPQSLYAGRAA
jgi:hypothetical protein